MRAELGKVIQMYREKAGWTQDELGKLLGVSQQTIAKWEGGKSNPRPKAMRLLIEALKIDGQRLKEVFPNSDYEGWEIPDVLSHLVLDDPDPLPPPTQVPRTFAEATFGRALNSLAMKKLLMPIVDEADPSSKWDQIVRTQWGNWRVDYMNDELYAKFLHAPNTAVLTSHLRVNIYRHLWKFMTFNGGRTDDPNYYIVVITFPEDQPIDFAPTEARNFAPAVSNTRMLRRITSEALSNGIFVVLARSPADVVSILTDPSKIGLPGWDWPGHEWDENPDD